MKDSTAQNNEMKHTTQRTPCHQTQRNTKQHDTTYFMGDHNMN